MDVVDKVVDPIDSAQRRHRGLAFPYAVVKKFNDDNAGSLASMLAFYAFTAIFSLLLVLTTVLGYVLASSSRLRQDIIHSAVADIPLLSDLRTGQLTGHWYALVISGLVSLWGARGVADAAQNAFNTAWGVPFASRPGFPAMLGRSFGLLTVMTVALVVTGFLSGIGGSTGTWGVAVRVGTIAISTVVNVGLFLLGFRLATAREIRLADMWVAAVASAVVWQMLLASGTLLIAHQVKHSEQLYGTFGVVLGLLAWLRLQAQLTLYALEADVVRVRRLWPRSLAPPPLTAGDRRAYESYAETTRRRPTSEQVVNVRFPEGEPAEPIGQAADQGASHAEPTDCDDPTRRPDPENDVGPSEPQQQADSTPDESRR
jgi:membrane protein